LPPAAGIHQEVRGVRHLLSLSGGRQEILRRLSAGPVARAIHKAQREGVTTEVTTSPADLMTFYRLHLETRRRLGVPVQPKRFLENIWRECIAAGLGFVVVARWQSRAIATGLFLGWNGTLIYKFGASDPHHWHLRPNNLVFWTAIQEGSDRGYRWLDLGRSDLDNQGLREFKRRWGAAEVPLVYSHVADNPPSRRTGLIMPALTRLIQNSPPIVCRAIGELLYRRAAGRFA
jgi:lipid II:glycine glycyltransferase (peptidoglycan interpeptide bridge formation enzyme)